MSTRFARNRKNLLTRYKDSRLPIRLIAAGAADATHLDVVFDRPVQIAPGAGQLFAVLTTVGIAADLFAAVAQADGLTFRLDLVLPVPTSLLVWPYLPEGKWITQLASYVDSQPFSFSNE